MVSDHKKDAAALRTESKSGKDPDVKAWAAKTLPTVEDHLKQFEQAGHHMATSQTPEKKSRCGRGEALRSGQWHTQK
jgi:putative membrane protein